MPRPARKRATEETLQPQKKQKKAKTEVLSHVEISDDVDNFDDLEDEDTSSDISDESSMGKAEAREAIAALQVIFESTGKKSDPKAFEKKVKEEEKRLLGLLEDFEKEMKSEDEEFKSQFAEFMAAALTPIGLKPPPSTELLPIDPSPENHPLYTLSQTLVDRSKGLINEYEGLVEYTNKLELPEDPSSVFDKDYEEARRIISVGKKASAAQIERLLKYDTKEKKRRRPKSSTLAGDNKCEGSNTEFNKDAHLQATLKMGCEELQKDGHKEKRVYGWGKVASGAQKAMKALVKALPSEDAGR